MLDEDDDEDREGQETDRDNENTDEDGDTGVLQDSVLAVDDIVVVSPELPLL